MWTFLRLGKSSNSCLHAVMLEHLLASRLFRAGEVREHLHSASCTYAPPSSSLCPLVQVSYGIGLPHPLSVYVDTYKTGKLPDEAIQEAVLDKFDFRPGKIMQVCGRSRGCCGTLWRLHCASCLPEGCLQPLGCRGMELRGSASSATAYKTHSAQQFAPLSFARC